MIETRFTWPEKINSSETAHFRFRSKRENASENLKLMHPNIVCLFTIFHNSFLFYLKRITFGGTLLYSTPKVFFVKWVYYTVLLRQEVGATSTIHIQYCIDGFKHKLKSLSFYEDSEKSLPVLFLFSIIFYV